MIKKKDRKNPEKEIILFLKTTSSKNSLQTLIKISKKNQLKNNEISLRKIRLRKLNNKWFQQKKLSLLNKVLTKIKYSPI